MELNDENDCQHDWLVISTSLADVVLIVECSRCNARGIVGDPSVEEWKRAFYAPSNPYRWTKPSRVGLLKKEVSDGK
jgi:hypothetical protein